jgi:carbon storage regulator
MLVLSRQRDETIMIGDDIEVTVVDIRGDKVRLGVNAPRELSVHRKEVYEAIRRENRAAAQAKPEDLDNVGNLKPTAAPAKTQQQPQTPSRSTRPAVTCGSR